jgi:hypothetical protein
MDPQQLIPDLLAAARSRRAKPNCERCHTAMQDVDFIFWVYGTDTHWLLPLPICRVCSKQELEHLSDSVVTNANPS